MMSTRKTNWKSMILRGEQKRKEKINKTAKSLRQNDVCFERAKFPISMLG